MISGFLLLGRYPYPPAHTFLLDFLSQGPQWWLTFKNNPQKEQVLIAAAQSLESADVKAVETLHALLEKSWSKDLENALRSTVQVIQSRVGNADHGWLSISDPPEAGTLSLADYRQGTLQLVDEDKHKS